MACVNVTSHEAMEGSYSHLLPMSSESSSCMAGQQLACMCALSGDLEMNGSSSWMSNGRPADTKQPRV